MGKQYLLFLLVLYSVCAQQLFAQKINNNWLFGYNAGLNFTTSPPTPFKNDNMVGIDPPYYTSCISDTAGKLLFYTDGFTVWNSYNKELEKFNSWWPWKIYDTLKPLFCPYPENDSLYYLFGIGSMEKKLISVTINKVSNLGRGAIVYPQTPTNTNYYSVYTQNAAFMLAGTVHCNQRDTWIVTVADNSLSAFLVTPAGVSAVPVVSPLPPSVSQDLLNKGYSNIKFSANGEKLMMPVISQNKMLVFDFNNQTGMFTNPVLLGIPANEFLKDAELSPSGKRLYYASYVIQPLDDGESEVELHSTYQLNLEAGTATDIENNRFMLNAFPDRGGCPRKCFIINRCLQMGPDGKIYLSQRDIEGAVADTRMHVIDFPDKLREEAYYIRNYFDLKIKYKFFNVNYIKSGSFSLKENGILARKKVCLGLPTEFSLLFTKIDSVKWDFGDPASDNNNYSESFTPSHTYANVGLYTVKAVIYKNCLTDTAVSQISIDPDPIVRIPSFIKDTTVCIGTTITMDATATGATGYSWSDGLIYANREIDKPGQFQVKAYNACSNDQKAFVVNFTECPCDVFVPSAFTPNNDGLNDNFKPLTKCFAQDYQFKVFSRYGNVIFSSKEVNKGWNGNSGNNPLPTGVYVWTLTYKNPANKQVFAKHGTVTLIR